MDDNPYRPPIPSPAKPSPPFHWKVAAFILIGVFSFPVACVVALGMQVKIENIFIAHEQSKHHSAVRDADDLDSWQQDVTHYGAIAGFTLTAIGLPVMTYWAVLQTGILLRLAPGRASVGQSRGARNSAPEDNVAGMRDRGSTKRYESDSGIRM